MRRVSLCFAAVCGLGMVWAFATENYGQALAAGLLAAGLAASAAPVPRSRSRVLPAPLAIDWAQLARIVIITTDEGPFADDLFWAFETMSGEVSLVPGSAIDDRVFDALARLPDVDYGAIVAAQGSTDHARFLVYCAVKS